MKKIMPTAYLLILLMLAICLHFVFPIKKVLEPPYSFLGVILIFLGCLLNIEADRLFRRDNTSVKPDKTPSTLEESGPFNVSRHPMYLGMASILAGVSVVLGTVAAFFTPLLFIALMEILFLPDEERNLEETFGDRYVAYKAKIRRWI